MTDKEDTAKEILIVEDSGTQLELLRRLLTASGYKVSVAGNGAEGLAAAREHVPDLIISDIMMPVMDGYQLCRKLKDDKTLNEIPVLLLTQLSEPEEVIRGLEAGADNYITKPYDNEFLLAKVKLQLLSPIRFKNNPKEKCVEFTLQGKYYSVRSGRGQTLNFLLSTYENVVRRNLELYQTQGELERLNEQLEEKVKQRTAALVEEVVARKQLGVDLVKRNTELLALTTIYKMAQEKTTLSELFDAALGTISGLLGLDTGGIYLLEADKKTLSLYSSVGLSEGELNSFSRLAIGEGAAGLAAAEMKPVIAEADNYPSKRLAAAVKTMGIYSLVGIPILAGEELVGAMSFASRQPHVFHKDELDLLSALGRQIGTLQQNTMLYEKLMKSQAMLSNAQTLAHLGDWELDLQTGKGIWSDESYRIFGFEPGAFEPTFDTFDELVHPEDRIRVKEYLDGILSKHLSQADFDVRIIRPDGAERVIYDKLEVITDKNGKPVKIAGINFDITERKIYERKLEIANQNLKAALEQVRQTQAVLVRSEKLAALGALAAGVAHEIKNPLNIISTSIQLLQMEEALSPEEKERYGTVTEQVNRIVKIIDNMRDYARERKPEIKNIDLVELLKKTVALVEYEMKVESINVEQRYCAASLSVEGDRDQLAQVFLNLITNARFSVGEKKKAKSAERKEGEKVWMGLVDVSMEKKDGFAVIKFSDNGVGIPRKTLGRIFDPFFTTKTEGRGTGLGLSISLGIIENHHGTIGAESEEEEGAAFTIRLPLA